MLWSFIIITYGCIRSRTLYGGLLCIYMACRLFFRFLNWLHLGKRRYAIISGLAKMWLLQIVLCRLGILWAFTNRFWLFNWICKVILQLLAEPFDHGLSNLLHFFLNSLFYLTFRIKLPWRIRSQNWWVLRFTINKCEFVSLNISCYSQSRQ